MPVQTLFLILLSQLIKFTILNYLSIRDSFFCPTEMKTDSFAAANQWLAVLSSVINFHLSRPIIGNVELQWRRLLTIDWMIFGYCHH